jgi:hypothetical protein
MDCMSDKSGMLSRLDGGTKVVEADPDPEPVLEELDDMLMIDLIEPGGELDCERSGIVTNRFKASLMEY